MTQFPTDRMQEQHNAEKLLDSESFQNAAVNPYALLRISDRVFGVIERASHSRIFQGIPDVMSYKIVFKGKYGAAAKELARLRGIEIK